jgi:hypothetical protein
MTVSHSTPRIADVILEQLGGSRFLTMTGASYLVAGDRALHMRLPRNASCANRLTIVLEAGDTYTVTFYRSSTGKRVSEHTGVFVEQLRPLFERVTNLATSLGDLRAAR